VLGLKASQPRFSSYVADLKITTLSEFLLTNTTRVWTFVKVYKNVFHKIAVLSKLPVTKTNVSAVVKKMLFTVTFISTASLSYTLCFFYYSTVLYARAYAIHFN